MVKKHLGLTQTLSVMLSEFLLEKNLIHYSSLYNIIEKVTLCFTDYRNHRDDIDSGTYDLHFSTISFS